jgi:hypothetical protein
LYFLGDGLAGDARAARAGEPAARAGDAADGSAHARGNAIAGERLWLAARVCVLALPRLAFFPRCCVLAAPATCVVAAPMLALAACLYIFI